MQEWIMNHDIYDIIIYRGVKLIMMDSIMKIHDWVNHQILEEG